MSARRSQRSAAIKAKESITDNAYDRVSRSSRRASDTPSSATVSRGNLTVKLSSSKLREAVRSSPLAQTVTLATKEGLSGAEILDGKRSRNVRKSYVLESDSEEEDEEMEDVADEDAEGEDEEVEEDEDMDAEDDGLGDEDAEGDVDMDLPPPPPVIKISKASNGKQTIVAKLPPKTDTKTVGQKEVDMGSDDDEELSELDSDIGEEVEDEEAMQTGNEEDAEGEDEEVEDQEEDQGLDSEDDTPGGGSRGSTPDLSKLTKRQRAALEEGGSGHLLALPDGKLAKSSPVAPANRFTEVQTKKHLTAEEHAMRRAEMARRRKNLSEKRNEEEKACSHLV
jgi:Ino eighty subunit 2